MTLLKMDSGAQMNRQLQQIYKTWEDASCDISQGTRDLSGSVVTLTTALDPLKHLVLIYIFQMLFPGDSSSEQEGEIEDTQEGDGAFYYPHTTYKILTVALHGVL